MDRRRWQSASGPRAGRRSARPGSACERYGGTQARERYGGTQGVDMNTLSVDESRCTGHGRCYTVSPDLLSDDEEGYVTLRGSSMEITGDQLASAQRAVAACPERALSLVRSG